MKAIILCAGKGKRTGLSYPKCLQKFSDGTTILEKKLKVLKKIGFKEKNIIFATGFKEDLIKKKQTIPINISKIKNLIAPT